MQHYLGTSPRERVSWERPPADPRILDAIPRDAGPRLTTYRGGAVYSVRAPGSQRFLSDTHFVAVTFAPSANITAAFAGEKPVIYDAPVGMIVISPAFLESESRWNSHRENISVALPPESLTELAEHEFGGRPWELQPLPFGTVDLKALQLAQMLKAELIREEPPNELLVDSIVTLFGIHILRSYTSHSTSASRPKGGLSVAAAKRVEEYLKGNFARKLSVNELAALCELSTGYFIQAFTRTFGEPPHKYLINLRISFAEKLLLDTDMTIAEVAYLSGFSSQSHLTSAMRRYKQATPALLRLKR